MPTSDLGNLENGNSTSYDIGTNMATMIASVISILPLGKKSRF